MNRRQVLVGTAALAAVGVSRAVQAAPAAFPNTWGVRGGHWTASTLNEYLVANHRSDQWLVLQDIMILADEPVHIPLDVPGIYIRDCKVHVKAGVPRAFQTGNPEDDAFLSVIAHAGTLFTETNGPEMIVLGNEVTFG